MFHVYFQYLYIYTNTSQLSPYNVHDKISFAVIRTNMTVKLIRMKMVTENMNPFQMICIKF